MGPREIEKFNQDVEDSLLPDYEEEDNSDRGSDEEDDEDNEEDEDEE